jgi:hypothetical protein
MMITLLTIGLVIFGGAVFFSYPVLGGLIWAAAYFIAKQGGPNDTDHLAATVFTVAVLGGGILLFI